MAVSESPADYEALIQKAKDAAPPGPCVPKSEPWLVVAEHEYPRFQVRVNMNVPGEVWAVLRSRLSTTEERVAAWGRIVLEHNQWCDPDGNLYPQPPDLMFWTAIPQRLFNLIEMRFIDALGERPLVREYPTPNGRGR